MVIEAATGYALERLQFGQPIAFFESIRRKLADMVVRTFLLDAAIYRAVGLMDRRIATSIPTCVVAMELPQPRTVDRMLAPRCSA